VLDTKTDERSKLDALKRKHVLFRFSDCLETMTTVCRSHRCRTW